VPFFRRWPHRRMPADRRFTAAARSVALKYNYSGLIPAYSMAIRIEKAFGPKMDTLLRMQTAYEIAEARDSEGIIKVKRCVAEPSPLTTRRTLGIEPQ
jgi:hypothetical protein